MAAAQSPLCPSRAKAWEAEEEEEGSPGRSRRPGHSSLRGCFQGYVVKSESPGTIHDHQLHTHGHADGKPWSLELGLGFTY